MMSMKSASTARRMAPGLLKTAGVAVWLLVAIPPTPAVAADVVYIDFNPGVIDPRVPESVIMTVQTDGTVESAVLALYSGGQLDLAQIAPDSFEIVLSPEQVLFLYGPAKVQHNFIGYLETYRGGVRLGRRNVFINVADEMVPSVSVRTLAPDARASAHVLALFMPGGLPSDLDRYSISRRFYELYPDDYDFLNIVSVPMYNANRTHIGARNDVLGIGLSLADHTAEYGSAGRLHGINRFPILSVFDLAEEGALHETGHTWIDFLGIPGLGESRPHWPISSTAAGIMGVSLPPNGVGVNFPYHLTPLGGSDYRLEFNSTSTTGKSYGDLELYLMGLMAPAEVGPQIVFPDQTQAICDGCVLTGGSTVTIDDIIAFEGPRSPAYPGGQVTYKMATIVVSTLRPLTDREIAFVDYFAARGEATTPLPYSSGFASGITQPFAVATLGRGRWVTTLGPPPRLAIDIEPRRSPNRIDIRSKGTVTVAILSGEGFDPSVIEPTSLRFGPDGVGIAHDRDRLKDLNADGVPDLLARFRIQGAGFVCGMTEAVLNATTSAGQEMEGSDSVVIEGCSRPPRKRGHEDHDGKDRDRDGDHERR